VVSYKLGLKVTTNGELLFSRNDIGTVLQAGELEIRTLVEQADADDLLTVSEDDFVRGVVEQCRLDLPVLLENDAHLEEPKETKTGVVPSIYSGHHVCYAV
jgi:hypothetical protein